MKPIYPFSQNTLFFCLGVLLLLGSFAFVGCTDDRIDGLPNSDSKEMDLQFRVVTAKSTLPKMQLKSGQLAYESHVENIQVLVFENDKYKYRTTGVNIATDEVTNEITFKARLKSSTQPTSLCIVANAIEDIEANEPLVDESSASVKKRIGGSFPSPHLYFRMWASYDSAAGIATDKENTITNIKLMRAMARVDIVNANAAPFELSTIQTFNVANKIQTIPNNATPTPSVTAPSIQDGTTYTVNSVAVPTTSADASTGQIYLPEAEAPASENLMQGATCLVIGGFYNHSTTIRYYRLDIDPGISGHPFGQILRNHRYQFNITRINSDGFDTAQEAANNLSSGIDASIVLWKDYIHNIVFDSQAYFGVSTNTPILGGKINSIQTLLTETDVPEFTLCWANAQGVPQGTPSETSIENDFFSVTKSSDASTIDIKALTYNPIGSSDRIIRYVVAEAKDLQMLITIIQEPDEFNPGNVNWAPYNVDEPGTFVERIQDMGKIYQWNRRVAWSATGSVTGWDSKGADGNAWEDVTDPCPIGWRVPTSKELLALVNESPGKIWRSIYSGYEISGMWLAATQLEAASATFAAPGAAIFMPAVGGRSTTGVLFNQQSSIYYWADNTDVAGTPYWLSLVDGTSNIYPSEGRSAGATVRCVRANN